MVDLKFDTLEISCHTELSEFGLVKKLTGNFCIGVWKSTYCPYIESGSTLFDIDDEEIARISCFWQAAERHFQSLAGPRNVSMCLMPQHPHITAQNRHKYLS